ncbi:MAG: hypothetical protein ACRD1X_05775 [Vicinamibacteria bacterium]
MSATRIADVLRVRNRFMRSIHLERDFGDGAIRDYIVTPQAKAMLERLVLGLAFHSHQRAWRITGDYGTGKSSFALALAHLLTNRRQHLPLALRQVVDFRLLGTGRPQLVPVLVTGSREPIGVALLRSLQRALEGFPSRGKRSRVVGKLRFLVSAATRPVSDAVVIDLLVEANAYVCGTGKGTGLLVVLDELGKFLEFAALHPDRQDVFLLQSLAEAAARSAKHPLLVVGLLHQGFNAYAEQLSQTVQKEWEKVAGRFEELLFNQPLEQTAGLVANALNVRTERLPRHLGAEAKRDMARTLELGWYGPAATQRVLLETAAQLYPLHPTVLPLLVRLFSRFGQNERSLFSFLLSDEPFALQDFSQQSLNAASFYRLHHLYDYARAAFGSRLSVQSYRSHWNQIESVVESFPRGQLGELQILKTVALLNLVDVPSLLATEDALATAVGSEAGMNVRHLSEALRHLRRDKHVLHHRGAAGGYCLWPHTSVNLENAYQEACRVIGALERISALIQESLGSRPLVARRHYIETGNLRHFNVSYTPVADLAAFLREEPRTADGRIVVPLCETEEERQQSVALAQSAALRERPDILVAIPKPLGALVGLVQECQRWQWISQNVPELNNDSYAAEEVSRQMAASRQILEKRIRSYVELRQFTETMELQWFHQGRSLPVSSGRELLAMLSRICDDTYDRAPRIRNELVNRHVLSSAAAAARMRLIERILKFPTQPLLGMEPTKKPPEMSMYLSVLKQAGLHREADGGWAIVEPPSNRDPCCLRPVFQRILELLEETPDSRVRVSELFADLRRRPYGVRDGLVPLLLAVFAVVHEQNLAFYENGAFLRHLSGEEFLRLIKVPESFEVQYCRIAGVRAVVFEKLLKLLHPGESPPRRPDILDVVRPLCQFAAQLPAFTHRTRTLSAEAASVREALLHAEEPAALLFKQLPTACGFQEFESGRAPSGPEVRRFVEMLKRALADLKAAYPDLLGRMEAALAAAFDRPGTFEAVRGALSEVAAKLLVAVADPGLKAFCFRLADTTLPEAAWVESLGSLLCAKPPSKWVDADADAFQEELKRFARQFQRVEAMTFDAVKDKERSAIRVAVTRQDGVEVDHVLYVGAEEEAQAAEIETVIGGILQKTNRVGLVAASRALGKALSGVKDSVKHGASRAAPEGREIP